jgi:hypothetical protein
MKTVMVKPCPSCQGEHEFQLPTEQIEASLIMGVRLVSPRRLFEKKLDDAPRRRAFICPKTKEIIVVEV